MKPTKCPAKGKNEARKALKRGEESEILLSAQATCNILHLDQKVAKCTTCKWHDSDQKTARLASKRIFQQNFQRKKGSLQKVSGRN